MRSRGTLIALCVAVACLVAGAAAFAAGGQDGADPEVRLWPNWTGEVTCGAVPFDPLVAFSRPQDAATGRRPSEVALRRYIQGGGIGSGAKKPLDGWRLLGETPFAADFGKGSLARGFIAVMTMRQSRHNWSWSSYSSRCLPQLLRGHRPAITWTLASGQHLRPSTKTIKVDLGPGECASGRSQNERLERPRFRVENHALLMALWLRPVHGPQNCVGILEPPVMIQLPQRLGHLKLLDGGVFPPQPPVEREER